MSKSLGRNSSTLTQQQLQVLGCIGKDMTTVTIPPMAFPPLISKPLPFELSVAENYKILWKEDFINYMMASRFHRDTEVNENNRGYSDSYLGAEKCKLELPLALLPNELKVKVNGRKKNKQHLAAKRMKTANECLKLLEKKEYLETTASKEVETDSEGQGEEFEDDEMDDDNDYGNNYFDNGESFNEEDDNFDDGPTY